MLGSLELKNDDWVKAKETLRAAKDATEGVDSYATLALVSNHALYFFQLCYIWFEDYFMCIFMWASIFCINWRHKVHAKKNPATQSKM